MFQQAFEGDIPVLTFPAGLCSRCDSEGVVEDLDWRPNFIKRASQTGRSIVPVYVEGRLSKRFYRWAKWRKRLGIKGNVEMLLLPSEMFGQKGRHFRLIFGSPISVDDLRADVAAGSVVGSPVPNDVALAAEVKRRAYSLAMVTG
jgi:putative hemolysin